MNFFCVRTQRAVGIGWIAAVAVGSASAGVSLKGETALVDALRTQPPCCVIDARSESQRQAQPLENALAYKPGLRIVPTASVVVIADDDTKARTIGAALARQHPGKTILAVRGGAPVWQATLKALETLPKSSAIQAQKGVLSFVIPHNTCESGEPLQVLTSKPKP